MNSSHSRASVIPTNTAMLIISILDSVFFIGFLPFGLGRLLGV